jgi:hypothetical protein
LPLIFLVLIRDDPLYPRHQRSINPYTDMKTAIVPSRFLILAQLTVSAQSLESVLRGGDSLVYREKEIRTKNFPNISKSVRHMNMSAQVSPAD